MKERECEIHGKYAQTGESKECPICEYYYYIEFPEKDDWEHEGDNE